MKLRDYQEVAIHELRVALALGHQRLLLYSPTGSGKTEMAMAMIRGALAKGKRVAFIVNRKELVDQASRRFFQAGIIHGIIQAENTARLDASVLVCSIDTVHVRGLPEVELILIDEAHAVAGSKKYRDLLFKRNNLPIIGLSATPFSAGLGKRYDQLGGPLFEKLVKATSIRELVEQGFLVDLEVFAPATPDLTGVATRRDACGVLDYVETQLAKVVDQPDLIGDIVANWQRLAEGKQTVCFATSIPHSRHIVEAFSAVGISAAHIDCYTDDVERAALLEKFRRGEITVLCNVALLAEGWDAPATECMILARPTKSLIRWIQMTGRVLRPFCGKAKALLLDHSGTTARLGFPTDDLPLELDTSQPKTSGSARRQEPLPKACPQCQRMKPARVHACPTCHFEPERQSDVIIKEGDLVRMARKKSNSKQHVYSQLLAIARQRGRDLRWVGHRFREFFGMWPYGLKQITAAPTIELLQWVKSRNIAYAKSKCRQGSPK